MVRVGRLQKYAPLRNFRVGQSWTKFVRVGQSWLELDKIRQIGSIWTELDTVGQSWTELDKILIELVELVELDRF